MNAWRIALFIFILQSMIILVGTAQIPIACDPDDMTSCIYFNENIIGTTTLGSLITSEVESGQYKTAQIETDIFNTDIYTATTIVLSKTVNIIIFMATGIFQLTRFFLGWSPIATAIAVMMQVIAYYFFMRTLTSAIKEGKGEI